MDILDLSTTGMLIETTVRLAVGESLQIELPLGGAASASIVWSSGSFYGCRFDKPISSAAVSAALLKSHPEATSAPAGDLGDGKTLPGRLRQLRLRRGLSLARLAERLGVSRQTVWYWENGRNRPDRENLAKLARSLGVGPQDVLSDQPAADPLPKIDVGAALEEHKAQIANLVGTAPDNVRITIEV